MNVHHIVASLSRHGGGVSSYVLDLSRYLQRQDVQVSIWGLEDEFTQIDVPKDLIRFSVMAKARGPKAFGYSRGLARRLQSLTECTSAVIHSHGLWMFPNLLAYTISNKKKIPLVISPHGMLEPWGLSNNRWKKMLPWLMWEKKNVHSAACIHTTAMSEANHLRVLGLRNPIAVIPIGVEVDRHDTMNQSNSTYEDDKKIKKTPRSILFLSRIHRIKGLMNLVAAWDRIRPEGWRVVVAGPDERGYQSAVERALKSLGLQDAFEFVGRVNGDQKSGLYNQAELFVLPTFSENFGIVVAEALAYCTPVITTKGAPWEGLVTHHCGWWVDIGIEPLAQAIKEAISLTDDERQAMGLRGRAYVEDCFSWPRIAEQMKSVYEWVLDKGPMPDCVMVD